MVDDEADQFFRGLLVGDQFAAAQKLGDATGLVHQWVLVELIKVDLEQRTTKGKSKLLTEYIAEYPELIEPKTGEPSCDLIYEEYHIRRGAGQPVTLSEYCMRYPKSAAALKRYQRTLD